MTTFIEGDLVRAITDEGDAAINSIIEIMPDNVLKIADQFSNITYVDRNDYELVKNDVQTFESKPMTTNTPARNEKDIHEDISKMFVQVIQYMEEAAEGSMISVEIGTTYYSGDEAEVEFRTRIGHGSYVVSSNLFDSARVTVDRHVIDATLKPLSLSLYKEDK